MDKKQTALLKRQLAFVLAHNDAIRFTAITDPEKAWRLHVLDSLLVLPELAAAPEGALLDIGTGAGYPGLPLAVASKRQVCLLDSSQKKAALLQSFLDSEPEISTWVSTCGLRAEILATKQAGNYAVVVARAVSTLPSLLELAAPLLQLGGYLIALKGRPNKDETERSDLVAQQLNYRLVSSREYTVLGGLENRRVFAYERFAESEIVLPRRPGRAQKKPLA